MNPTAYKISVNKLYSTFFVLSSVFERKFSLTSIFFRHVTPPASMKFSWDCLVSSELYADTAGMRRACVTLRQYQHWVCVQLKQSESRTTRDGSDADVFSWLSMHSLKMPFIFSDVCLALYFRFFLNARMRLKFFKGRLLFLCRTYLLAKGPGCRVYTLLCVCCLFCSRSRPIRSKIERIFHSATESLNLN